MREAWHCRTLLLSMMLLSLSLCYNAALLLLAHWYGAESPLFGHFELPKGNSSSFGRMFGVFLWQHGAEKTMMAWLLCVWRFAVSGQPSVKHTNCYHGVPSLTSPPSGSFVFSLALPPERIQLPMLPSHISNTDSDSCLSLWFIALALTHICEERISGQKKHCLINFNGLYVLKWPISFMLLI